MCKFITKITVPRTLWGLKPLQGYIRELAAICSKAERNVDLDGKIPVLLRYNKKKRIFASH
ncbi:hypothetical protein [Phocaeicola barnesiae]|uniref:hypothetical protein n=1 Tax=Phocaeicola barnesiae TaxID=376804 RepID=UPI001D93B0FD|nr:hypothetical protein [Phocaeicola barnesiae]HJG77951.1 hypothetical protein [Phocaeicola barnesiae]